MKLWRPRRVEMRGRRESTGRPGALGPALPERSLFRHLVRDARPFSWHLAVILALSLVSAPLALLTPVPLKVAIDSAVGSHPPPGWLQPIMGTTHASILVGVVVLLVGIALLSELQQLLLAQMRAYTGEQLVMSLRTRLFGHLQRLSLSYHDTRGTPDSVYRVQYDAQAIKNVAVDGFIPFIAAGFTLVGMIIVTARIDHQLALVALAISPPLFFIVRVYRRRLRRGSRGVKRLESQALGVVQEVLTVLRVVKTFGQEQREEERFVQCSREGMGARLRLVFVEGVFGLLVGLITVLGTGAVLLIGVGHVRSGALTLGSLLLVLGYIAQLYDPLKTMSKQVTQVQDSMASAERVYALLETQPEVLERNGAQSLVRASGRLQFDCVSFAYEGRAAGLRNVSFEIAPGTRLGIEGVTGAGKTTLVSLIARFYDPSAGRILLDGVDLRDYRLADVRRQVSYVLQEPVLFATTIRENIAYARPDANEQDLVAAAQAACAHEFITALPDGYDTTVGERGMQLSGGERQRLSLARAFLKDAPILILDEPTSALDAATEAELFAAQERVMQGRTSIVVAHRPRLLEGCDLRVRIEAGTLVLLTGVPHRTRGSRPHSARPALAEQRHVGKRPSTGSAKPAALSHDASHPTAATQEPADSGRTRASLPPTTVIEQARRLLGAGRGAPELVESQTLDRGVYRLRFELHGRRESLVVKRLSRRRARVNEMVARRWLPREGMASACPRSRAIVRGDLDDEKVWQIYEDVGGRGLDSFDADPMAVELVVELIAQLHLRFASCPVLGDCRTYGDDLGIAFFDRNVGRCLRYLSCFEAIAAKLSPDHRELRDRLLDRMERLARERDQRARLFDAVGGPSTLLHGDLWTSNTLITGEDDNCGARLIDWDHAGAGPVSYDLSTFLLRFAPDDRFWVLAKYRDVVARAGWQLPTNDELNVLFDTAECARDASCLVEAVVAAARGEPWGFPQMAEIERWFANITPTIASEP